MAIASPVVILASALAAGVLLGVFKLYSHRRSLRDLPKPPYSWFWGHLKLFGETMRLFPGTVHPQLVFTHMYQTYNLPEVFYVDLWPLGPVFLVLASPDAGAHAVQTRGYGKHAHIDEYVAPMVGKNSIVSMNGAGWKASHQMLAPAFKPSAVRGLLAQVAEETLAFGRVLGGLAPGDEGQQGPVFSAETLCGRLIFDIICRAVLGTSFGTQNSEGGSPILDDIMTPMNASAASEQTKNPIRKLALRRKAAAALKRSGVWLRDDVLKRYRAMKKEGARVADCLLEAVLIDRIRQEEEGAAPPAEQDPAWLDLLVVQLRTVLFGGVGTTTDTLCFIFMLLSVHPEKLQKLRNEHDRVCGTSIDGAVAMVENDPHRTAELDYTTSVIKETLRMYPIGFSIRQDDKDNGFMQYKTRRYPTANTIVAVCGHTMHYDPAIYADPAAFKPERWLGAAGQALPRNAWRPFELGPRACMGRELAVDEMRVVLLLTARWFDLSVADDGTGVAVPHATPRVSWTRMDTVVGDLAFQELGMEAKPRAGMPMRVRRTERPL